MYELNQQGDFEILCTTQQTLPYPIKWVMGFQGRYE
jgi:hypothetical protein